MKPRSSVSLSHFMGFPQEAVIIGLRFSTQCEGASEETFLCRDHFDFLFRFDLYSLTLHLILELQLLDKREKKVFHKLNCQQACKFTSLLKSSTFLAHLDSMWNLDEKFRTFGDN